MVAKPLRKRLAFGLATIALTLCAPTATQAQGFSTLGFAPNTSQEGGVFSVSSAQVLNAGDWAVGAMFDYADDPLVLYFEGEPFRDLVADQLTANLTFAIGITDFFELGLALPVVLHQQGDASEFLGVDASEAGAGIADPRLQAKLQFFNSNTDSSPGGIALGLLIDAYIPAGNPDLFRGDDGPRVHPRLALDLVLPSQVSFHVNAGYMVRPSSDLFNIGVDDTITYGVGFDAPVGDARRWHVLVEASGQSSVLADGVKTEELPFEAILGTRVATQSGLNVTGGFGVGVVSGFGAPDWRGILGFEYAPTGCSDCDGDTYPNNADSCPNRAEDFDGFEDADGCPDPDNDADGVPDETDACPLEPEDDDGFEDADGCPDPDNDGDGVLDAVDACPDVPEDHDAVDDEDGCPDGDNDNDGIADEDDACPNQAEDVDGFEDEDGCPDPDNDGDGLADDDDACPLEREDFDGFEDADGCPEEGQGLVTLTCEQIQISERVEFGSDSDEIERVSHNLLNQVAGVLRTAGYIRRVRVEGHTDSRGDSAYNLDLSQRRANAVRDYLLEAGVTQDIEALGLGEEIPIADNESSEGRRINRRVEFHVVEQDATCAE